MVVDGITTPAMSLLVDLAANGIELFIRDGRLRCRPKGSLTSTLRARTKASEGEMRAILENPREVLDTLLERIHSLGHPKMALGLRQMWQKYVANREADDEASRPRAEVAALVAVLAEIEAQSLRLVPLRPPSESRTLRQRAVQLMDTDPAEADRLFREADELEGVGP